MLTLAGILEERLQLLKEELLSKDEGTLFQIANEFAIRHQDGRQVPHGWLPVRCPTEYPTFMKKTSVYLSDEEVTRLAVLARREETSQAEVIRRAIQHYEPTGQGDRDFALAGIGDGPGDSVADLPEEELLEGFGS